MKKILIAVALVTLISACSSKTNARLKSDPYYESFYEKASFIMTKYEKQVYKYLPNLQARREFIQNFWDRRDPTPDTPENENRQEFSRRVIFANKWFHEGAIKRGWDTARGRILLQLGFPDRRYKEDVQPNLRSSRRLPVEQWYYILEDLQLTFIDEKETGTYTLSQPPPGLLSAIDNTLARYDLVRLNRSKQNLSFKTDYKNGLISIKVPTKNIFFVEKGKQMTARFQIVVRVHHNYVEAETIEKTDHLAQSKNDILNMKYYAIEIPYTISKKGLYFFDILIQDVYNQSKYRTTLSKKN